MSKPAKAQNPKPEWGFFAMIPRIVRTKYPELGASEKWLYTCLKDLCGDKGACFRTLPTLSEETGLSTGSLSAMIPALHDAGLIHATKKSRGLGGKKVWYITIVDIWGSNKEYCSNSEQSQNDTIQDLNNTPKSSTRVIQNMNDVVQDLNKEPEYSSKFERSCSNFVDRRRTIEEEQIEKQEEEGTYPASESHPSDSGSVEPTRTQFVFQVQGFSQFYHDFCIHAQDQGINDGLTLIVKNLNDVPQDAQCQICYKPVHGTHGYGESPHTPALSQSEIAEQIRSRIPEGDAILLERLNGNSHRIYRKSGRSIGELIPVGVDVSDGLLELITVDATPSQSEPTLSEQIDDAIEEVDTRRAALLSLSDSHSQRPVSDGYQKAEQKGETHVTTHARGGNTHRAGHNSADPGKQSLPAQDQSGVAVSKSSTARTNTGARTRKSAKVAPEFTEQGRKVYDAWCSLFKSPPRAAEKTIECADALYPLLVPWCKELKVSCAALLDEIQKHMYATDTNKFYKRGITLCDVERDFEKWQSAKTQESSKGKPKPESDPYSIAGLFARQNGAKV